MTSAHVGLYTGSVEFVDPFLNTYLVSTSIGPVHATALESGGSRRGGHVGGGVYIVGTQVLVAVFSEHALFDEAAKVAGLPNIILGSYAAWPLHDETDFGPTSIVQDTYADKNNNGVYRLVLDQEAGTEILRQDRSYNRPLDVLPGDWFKSTVLGGLILLSDFMTRIGVTSSCNWSFCGITDTATLSSHNIVEDTEGFLSELVHRGCDPIKASRMALTIAEGLGAMSSAAFVSAEDENHTLKLKAVLPNQAGLFRRTLFEGGSVEGVWDTYKTVLREGTDGVNTFAHATDPGVLSEIKRMDGVYRLRAAREIKLERTPAIPVPVQLAPLNGTESPVDETFEQTEDTKGQLTDTQIKSAVYALSEDEIRALSPLLHTGYADVDESELFFRGVRRDQGIWYIPSSAEARESLTGDAAPPRLPSLPPDQQEYSESDLQDLMTEAVEVYPGKQVQLSKTSSVFLMADDGGIVIGDGFGAEIRMHRGTVSIAAAGDIRHLPGRDMIEMIPGNRISKVGDRIEMSSTRGGIAMKAETNVQIVSGNGGVGVMSLENRATGTPLTSATAEDLQNGRAIGSGIILKSADAGISLLGQYIYGSGYSKDKDPTTSGVNNKALSCDIVMDSGAGAIVMTGNVSSMFFRQAMSIGILSASTGVYMQGADMTTVAAGRHFLQAQSMDMGPGTGSLNRYSLESSGVGDRPVKLPQPNNTTVQIRGNAIVSEVLQVKGQVQVQRGVIANDGCNAFEITNESDRVTVNVDGSAQNAGSSIAINGSSFANGVLSNMISRGVATSFGQQISDFAFPQSKSTAYRAGNFAWVGARWQSLLSASTPWMETTVTHRILDNKKTYPYPGYEVYEGGQKVLTVVADSGGGSVEISKLGMNEYPTNT